MGRPSTVRYRADRDAWVTTIAGKYVTLARGKRHRAAAMLAFHRLQATRSARSATGEVTVGELAERLAAWVADHRSSLTLEWYVRYLQPFMDWIGPATVAESVRPHHVTDWLASTTWSQSTQHGAITAVKRAFRWGARQGLLEGDHLAGLDKPGIKRRESILSPEQEQRVLEQASPALRLYLEFMRETGCRPSEVARIETRHLVGGTVVMPGKTTGRTGRARTIYLTARAAEIVVELVTLPADGPIFLNSKGRPWTRHALAWAMARVRAKLEFGPECTAESFRHGWVTDAKLRLPNSVVAELAGHTSTAMIDRYYGHLDQRREELAAAAAIVRPIADDQ